MKIVLISANQLTSPYPVYPLGLDYVAGALEPEHNVDFIDLNMVPEPAVLGEKLAKIKPDIIGISIRNIDNTDTSDPKGFVSQHQALMKTIRMYSDAIVVLGGSGFTIFPSRLLTLLGADFGIAGEGERFRLLVDAISRNKDPLALKGVVSETGSDKLPAPWEKAFTRKECAENPNLSYYLKHGAMLNLQTKRGCPFSCIYCTYPLIEGKKLRLIPPEEVAQTAVNLEKAGARYLFLTDSSFNADKAHSLEVAKAFKKAGLSIPWGAFFTPLKLSKAYFEQMASAGMTHAEFGTDALCDTTLKAYGKPFTAKDVLETHGAAVNAGLYVAHYFLPGGPGETPTTLEQTLSNIDKLKKTVLFLFCGMRIYPKTKLFDIAVAKEQITLSTDLLKPCFYESNQLNAAAIIRRIKEKAGNRVNWIIGSGGKETEQIIKRMYEHGHTGPLWEYLIR